MKRMDEIYAITNKMGTVSSQVNYFEELEYRSGPTYSGGNTLIPFSGLEEELYQALRENTLNIMKRFYNKYQEELAELCKQDI